MEGQQNGSEQIDPELEKAISEGFQTTMEYLQKPFAREPLAKELAKVQTMGATPQTVATQDKTYPKREANAIAGYFMTPIWSTAKKWLQKNPGTLGKYFDAENRRSVFKTKSLTEVSQEFAGKPRDLLFDLYQRSTQTLALHVFQTVKKYDSLVKRLTRAGTPQENWPTEARNFARYLKILPTSDFRKENFRGRPDEQLKAGFMAAELVSWGILEAIPRLYEKQFGKPISESELDNYIEKGRTFALYVASLHIDVFQIAMNEIFERETTGDTEKAHPLPFMKNVFLRTDGKFPVEVEKDALHRIAARVKKELPKDEPRTGCPAIVARDNGKNIITELYEWSTDTARQYYFPTLK